MGVFAIGVLSAFAENSQSTARQLVEVLQVDKPLRQIRLIGSLIPDMRSDSKQRAAEADAIVEKFDGEIARVYAAEFTEEELHDLLQFFRTPVGAKYIARQAAIRSQTMRLLMIAPKPNQALEPTATGVTPPAAQEARHP